MSFGRAVFVTYRPATESRPSGFSCRLESFPTRFIPFEYGPSNPAKAATLTYLSKFLREEATKSLDLIECVPPGKNRRAGETSIFVAVLPPNCGLNRHQAAK